MHPWRCLWAELEQDILVSWTFPKLCAVLGLPSGEESKGEVPSGQVFSCPHFIGAAGVWIIMGQQLVAHLSQSFMGEFPLHCLPCRKPKSYSCSQEWL